MPIGTKRERLQARLQELIAARAPWEPAWRSITGQLAPYRTVWPQSQINQGEIRDRKLYNSRPAQALRTLSAGLSAGVTSPVRDWFNLTLPDPDLDEYGSVKQYLDDCKQRL